MRCVKAAEESCSMYTKTDSTLLKLHLASSSNLLLSCQNWFNRKIPPIYFPSNEENHQCLERSLITVILKKLLCDLKSE